MSKFNPTLSALSTFSLTLSIFIAGALDPNPAMARAGSSPSGRSAPASRSTSVSRGTSGGGRAGGAAGGLAARRSFGAPTAEEMADERGFAGSYFLGLSTGLILGTSSGAVLGGITGMAMRSPRHDQDPINQSDLDGLKYTEEQYSGAIAAIRQSNPTWAAMVDSSCGIFEKEFLHDFEEVSKWSDNERDPPISELKSRGKEMHRCLEAAQKAAFSKNPTGNELAKMADKVCLPEISPDDEDKGNGVDWDFHRFYRTCMTNALNAIPESLGKSKVIAEYITGCDESSDKAFKQDHSWLTYFGYSDPDAVHDRSRECTRSKLNGFAVNLPTSPVMGQTLLAAKAQCSVPETAQCPPAPQSAAVGGGNPGQVMNAY